MYELVRVTDDTYYMDCPARVGVLRLPGGEAAAIDGGSDDTAAKKLLRGLEGLGLKLARVYVTHAHADHVGGCALLQARTGCRIFANGVERAVACHTVLQPVDVYGACPPRDLHGKFYMAKPSRVEALAEDSLPEGVETIPLPGHSLDMVGFRTKDDIVFLADALAAEETIRKYGIPFLWDVGAYLETLERIEGMEARLFVPAHAEPSPDMRTLARFNIDATNKTADRIESYCAGGIAFDTLLKKLFDAYAIPMTFGQHTLVGSTVRCYLTYLAEAGRVRHECADNVLVWIRE